MKPLFGSLSRRQFVGRLSAIAAGGLIARENGYGEPPASPFVRRVVRSPENTYFTYPHSHGFLADGTPVFASPVGNNGTDIEFISCSPEDPASARKLARVAQARWYYSVSQNDLMVISRTDGSAAVLDLSVRNDPAKKIAPRQIFRQEGWHIAADNDISRDGTQALITRTLYDATRQPVACQVDRIDTATGAVTTLAKDWPMDHAHFSPFDPAWISYCDNRRNADRLWVWNAIQAPHGRHLFNQFTPHGKYEIGHERAMFNKPALLVVAYGGESSARPRGLFEVGFDGSVRLVSESNRDFHCNVSRDGRWAVVSLQGVYDSSGARPDPNWLKTGLGYGFSDVMLVNMRSGARAFLYRGTNATAGQPYEVQPTISPDGRWVLLKDAREKRVLMLEIDPEALEKFLG